jgi:tetratricopeptide (TPR) repeat protein
MEVDPHGRPTEEFRAELEAAALEFERLGDDEALATVWSELANLEWMPCRFETAERAARRALEHARRSGDGRLVADALTPLIAAQAFGATVPGDGISSLDELNDDLARSRRTESVALVVRGTYRAMDGAIDEGRRLLLLGWEISDSLGLSLAVAAHEEVLGELETWAGDMDAAERALRSCYERLDRLGDEGHKSTAAASLARALFALGRHDEAERYASIAREIAAEDDVMSQVYGRTAQALVLAASGSFTEAEDIARGGVGLFLAAGSEAPNIVGEAWMDLAKVLRMAGKGLQADEAAREALALFERKGNRPASASTRAFIAELDA